MGWLIALGILILLAALPLGVCVRYDDAGLLVKLIAGPVKLRLFPRRKKEAQKEQKPTQKAAKGKPKEGPKETGGSLSDFLPLVNIALDFLNGFRRKLRIKRLEGRLILASDDPCDLAVNYGRAWAALGNLWPLLERCFVIQKRDVEVACDFTATETLVIVRADITISLGRLLGLLVCHGIQALKVYLNIQKSKEGGIKA